MIANGDSLTIPSTDGATVTVPTPSACSPMTGLLIPLYEYNQSDGSPFPNLPNPLTGLSPCALLLTKDDSITSRFCIPAINFESWPNLSASVNPMLNT